MRRLRCIEACPLGLLPEERGRTEAGLIFRTVRFGGMELTVIALSRDMDLREASVADGGLLACDMVEDCISETSERKSEAAQGETFCQHLEGKVLVTVTSW